MPQIVTIEKFEKRANSVAFMNVGDAPGKQKVEMRSQLHGHGGGAIALA
jgi:predicted metal-binding protein